MSKFYVYVDYTKESVPRPFYVGKGDVHRVAFTKRNQLHTNIANKYGIDRKVVFETDSEMHAFMREEQLITELRTFKDVKGGWGANLTIGGGGVCGRKRTVEEKKRISKALKGIPKSEKIKKKMRAGRAKKSVTQYSKDGEFIAEFVSAMEAGRQTGISSSSIGLRCRKTRTCSAGGFVWRFKGEAFSSKPKYQLTSGHKEKLRQAANGRKHSEETKRLIGDKSRGRKHSELTKSKISESVKRHHNG